MPIFHHHPQTISESESRELALDSYVLYAKHQKCITCGRTEHHSLMFEVWLHPTKTRSSNLRDLRPVKLPLKQLDIFCIQTKSVEIPVCVACVGSQKASYKANTVSSEEWTETLKRKYAAAPQEVKVAKTTATPSRKVVPTLDQI